MWLAYIILLHTGGRKNFLFSSIHEGTEWYTKSVGAISHTSSGLDADN